MFGSKGSRVLRSALSSTKHVSTARPFSVKSGSAENRVAADLFMCAVIEKWVVL